jgi:hypothetical protein
VASPAILKVDIIADATKAAAALKDTGDAAHTTGSKLGGIAKGVATGLAVGAVVSFGKASITAAEDSKAAMAGLENVFASMGDTTGKAASSAADYASALSKKIGVDDDAIIAAQTQLATFGEVSNATARAAGTFDRATAAAADLAAAGFGSLDANAVQLGKALNDPAKGIAALAKSGVTFTEAEKEQIAAMQAAGDMAGAQEIVLKAVEKQVKGTAAATATSSDKMNVAFGETQEAVGQALLPVFEQLAPILQTVAGFIQENTNWLLPLAGVILGVVAAIKVWTAIQTAFNIVMGLNPIVLVVAAIVALIAILVLAYQKVGWFRDFVDAAFAVVKGAFDFVLEAARAVWEWIKNNWPLLLAILLGPFGILISVVVKNFDTVKEVAGTVFDVIKDVFGKIGEAVKAAVAVVKFQIDLWVAAFNTIKDAATAVYDWVKEKIEALAGIIEAVVSTVKTAAGKVADAIKAPVNAVIKAWNDFGFTIPRIELKVGPASFGAGPWDIDFPNIPTLARGGVVASTGLALVHEGEMFSGVGRTFGNTTNVFHITTTGLGADAPAIQRAVANALRGYTARNGPLDVPVRASMAG